MRSEQLAGGERPISSAARGKSIGERELIWMMALLMACNAFGIDAILPALDDLAGSLGAQGNDRPVIVVHGNQVQDLPSSYKRYLMNYFRKALDVMGTPIKIEFREGANPFEGKKNQLTLAQQRKRRRMMDFHKNKK
mgnify:CR=1 FL=1